MRLISTYDTPHSGTITYTYSEYSAFESTLNSSIVSYRT